jgi:hypothetical protein
MSQAIRRAVQLHNQGKPGQAEKLYAAMLTLQPRQFDASHASGILQFRRHAHKGDNAWV